MFGEDAVTSKSDSVTALKLDQSQANILLELWRSSQPDRLTAYKERNKSSFPLHEKSEEFLKVPSLDDVESFLIKRFSSKSITHHAFEKLGYQGQIAAKTGTAIVLYIQQALRVLLDELKEDNPNLDLATQTTRDIFAIHHIYINCWFPVYRWSVM